MVLKFLCLVSSLVQLILPKYKEMPLCNAVAESATFRFSLTELSVLGGIQLALSAVANSPQMEITARREGNQYVYVRNSARIN